MRKSAANAAKSAKPDVGRGSTSAKAPAASVAPAGKVNVTPSVNFQAGTTARGSGFGESASETAEPVMFSNSMNSTLPLPKLPLGLYMISLMTTGPTRGAPFTAPLVEPACATKSVVPSLLG